jgi:hypothetical protein
LVGKYVDSPLIWAIITGAKAPYQSVADLRGGKVGISRIGSGSQVMASVLALREKWVDDKGEVEKLDCVVNDNFKGLRDSVNDGSTAFYMWERYTTKPYVDSGENRFIGFIDTPWPSWSIAASPSADSAALKTFLERLSCSVRAFDSAEARRQPNVDFIKEHFKYDEVDIRAWLETVKYPNDCAVLPKGVVLDTLKCARAPCLHCEASLAAGRSGPRALSASRRAGGLSSNLCGPRSRVCNKACDYATRLTACQRPLRRAP